jgi:predicted transcriptional regulator
MSPRKILRQLHRDHYEIVKQILQNVYTDAGGCRPSELAYGCELTWQQFRNYRDLLISRELLIPSEKGSIQRYEITPKGEHYLQLFAEIEDDLRPSVKDQDTKR